jgi:imidazolonepropionase-like amidohydrolase
MTHTLLRLSVLIMVLGSAPSWAQKKAPPSGAPLGPGIVPPTDIQPPTGKDRPSRPIAYEGATLIDGTGHAAVPDAVVLVKDDRIVAVGPRASVEMPKNAEIRDVSGRFIVPGLVDAHVHFFQSGGVATRPDIADLRDVHPYAEEVAGIRTRLDGTFLRYLASGVTAVVDMGGPFWNFDVRERSRQVTAPHVAVAGPLISTVDRPQLDLGDPPIIKAGSPKEARAMVRAQVARKADFIKLWFIVDKDKGIAESLPIMKAAIDEAHRAKLRVAVHATGILEARAAVEAGADILVHSVDDAELDDAFLELLENRGTIYIPNLVVTGGYSSVFSGTTQPTDLELRRGDPVVMASWDEFALLAPGRVPAEKTAARLERYRIGPPVMRKNLLRAAKAGITLAAGTDAGNIGTLHGPSLIHELSLMVDAGLSPMDALVAATRNGARVFSTKPDFGTLEVGRLADFLVLDADPLADIANLQTLDLVVMDGKSWAPDALVPPNPAWVVEHQVDAYNARDASAFSTFYSNDATVVRWPTDQLVAKGKEDIQKSYATLFTQSPKLHCAVLERIVSGNRVVDHELVTGLRGGPAVRSTAVYEVKNGLIERVTLFPNE